MQSAEQQTKVQKRVSKINYPTVYAADEVLTFCRNAPTTTTAKMKAEEDNKIQFGNFSRKQPLLQQLLIKAHFTSDFLFFSFFPPLTRKQKQKTA